MPKILDKPLSWMVIKTLVELNKFETFGREKDVLMAYHKDKESYKKYLSSEDMIKIKYLNYKPVLNREKKIYAVKYEQSINNTLCNNTYPYYVEKEIEHKLLWSTRDLEEDEKNQRDDSQGGQGQPPFSKKQNYDAA